MFKGGHIRCAVKFAVNQRRYNSSKKRRATWRRYNRDKEKDRAKTARRLMVCGWRTYLKTAEQCQQARDFIRRARVAFTRLQSGA